MADNTVNRMKHFKILPKIITDMFNLIVSSCRTSVYPHIYKNKLHLLLEVQG